MSAKILFVDDEPVWLNRYTEALRDAGHQVAEADSAESALDRLESFDPDSVVLDIMVPWESLETLLKRGSEAVSNAPRNDVRSGIKLYREIKRRSKDVNIIILSVLSKQEILEVAGPDEPDCVFLQKGRHDTLEIYTAILESLPGK